MGLQRRYALFELQKQLAPSEPDVHEFIIGLDSIAKAAGYGPDYFHRRYYDVPASKQAGRGIWSTGLPHRPQPLLPLPRRAGDPPQLGGCLGREHTRFGRAGAAGQDTRLA